MSTKYHVHLSKEDRQKLETLIRSGKSSARTQTRARILLLTDESQKKKKGPKEIAGKRYVQTTSHRKIVDWAHLMKMVSDELYPEADVIVVVMDNLNTHKLASFYATFEPEEARRLSRRLEIHYTPKHGSWLNMAEIELSALTRQCLDRRIPDQDVLDTEVQAWTKERNNKVVMVDWQFTTADARVKLKHLYPKIQS